MRPEQDNTEHSQEDACVRFGRVAFTAKNMSDFKNKSSQTGIPQPQLMQWAMESVHELRDKEQRVQSFYEHRLRKDPDNWFLLPPAHQYWGQFKTEDKKRKNKVQASGLHEIDPVLWCIRLIQAGILPEKVTYEIVDGKRRDIPPEQQSIQHLLATLFTHDTHEDFPLSARQRLIYEYTQALAIDKNRPLSSRQQFQLNSVLFHANATDAVTFKHVMYNEHGKKIEEPCFENDSRPLYMQEMIPNWAAILAKWVDRMGGTLMRIDQIPDTFSFERQEEYLQETKRDFISSNIIEQVKARFPELSECFDVVHAYLEINYKAVEKGLLLHTGNPDTHPNPESVSIQYDQQLLNTATKGSPYVELGVSPMYKLQTNFGHMANRKPRQSGIHADLERQFKPFIADHPITPIHHTTRIRRSEPQAAIA